MPVDLVYKGKAVVGNSIREVTIIIDEGIIVDVRGPSFNVEADRVLDYSLKEGVIALPGAIDIHVHLRGLNLSYKEDEYTGTRAAAKGGFTIVVDMPNTDPYINNRNSLLLKLEEFKRKAIVDYSLHVGIPQDDHSLNEIIKLRDNYVGFKVYPHDLNKGILSEVFEEAKKNKLLITVHAEHPELIKENNKPGYRWLTRTIEAELYALEKIVELSRATGNTRVHVTHVTNSYTLLLAKMYGFTTDTTMHYLLLNANTEKEKGALAKVNPPLRPEPMRLMLERDFRNMLIDVIASDHAPHSIDEKLEPFSKAPPGIVGLETTIPLLLLMHHQGWIDLVYLSKLVSETPAKILGLSNVGRIARGYIGNLTIIYINESFVIKPEEFESKAKYSPFEGIECKGKPIVTIVRGKIVYSHGEFHVDKGFGVNISTYKSLKPRKQKFME